MSGARRRRSVLVVAAGLLLTFSCVRLLPRWSAAPEAFSPATEPGDGLPGSDLRSTFESLSAAPVYPARAELLDENVAAWAARWRTLTRARETIDVDYFIFSQDVFGMAFMGRLLEKARDGVRVRMLLDAQGLRMSQRSYALDCLGTLAAAPNASVRIHRWMGRRLLDATVWLDPLVASASDHDKIVVVDGRESILGGRNVETKYFAHPDDLAEAFHDVDVLLEGPAVGKVLTRVFETTWDSDRVTDVAGDPGDERCEAALRIAERAMDAWLAGRPFPDDAMPEGAPRVPWIAELQRLPRLRASGRRPAAERTGVEAEVVDSLPRAGSPDDPVTRGLLRLFGAATGSVVVESPYVVLTNDAAETMEAAGRRGVRTTLLTNSPVSTDNALSQTYFMEQWPRLVAAAPDLRLFAIGTPHNLHSKVAVFDDRAVVIGSYNLDPFSMLISGEVVVALWSPEFARRVAARPLRMIAAGPPQVYEYTIQRDADGNPVHTATGEVAIGFGPADHTDAAQWPRPGVRVAFVRTVPWLFGLPSFF